MSADRPRRTLRTSTKLIPIVTPPSNSRRGSSAKQNQDTPTTSTGRRGRPPSNNSTPVARGGSSTGARRGRKPAVTKRPECFNHKGSTRSSYNDYHYGSDFEEESEPEHDSDEDQDSGQESDSVSSHDETLDMVNSVDIEDIASLSNGANLPIWLNPDIQVETLDIPQSSDDLLLDDKNVIFPLVGIYESIVKFYKSLRITPFKFEDFCACLSSPESSVMLVEVHLQILKAILREDEAMNVTYGPLEYKDSIQAAFYFLDNITWVDGLLTYFRTEKRSNKYIELIKENNYPFCSVEIRVKILNVLLNIFLSTNGARETLAFEDLVHEDHCRICGRLGELICCETCTSVAHLGCINPPIIDPPEEWKCPTCAKQIVPGLTDCLREEDRMSLRHEKLGYDRHGRSYWFLVRRILVESEDGKTSWYYSTHSQFVELLSVLSPTYEAELIENLNYHKNDILSQMVITEKLTNTANTQHRKTYFEFENAQLVQLQTSRELIVKQAELEKIKAEGEVLLKKQMEEAEKLKLEEEFKLKGELEKKRIREERLERRNKKKYGDDFENYEDFLDDSFQDMDCSDPGQHSDSASPEQKPENGNKEAIKTENCEEEIVNTTVEEMEISSQTETSMTENDVDCQKQSGSQEDGVTDAPPVANHEKPLTTTPLPAPPPLKPKPVLAIPVNPLQIQIEREIEQLKSELMDSEEGERMTRQKSLGLYKLGQENVYKSYTNYYTQDSTALSKLQHNEERDKKRFLSHKFSLTPISEFKWIGQYITPQNVINTMKSNLLAFENNIPLTLMHVNWMQLRKTWVLSVNNCKTLEDFKAAVIMFRGCLRDCLFNNIWMDGIGHFRLIKMNQLERDELKKTEKKIKKFKDDEDDRFKVIHPFVKYTIPCKHQLWKQKGEEYRLHGQFGWIWLRSGRSSKSRINYKYNLLNGPYKYVIQVKSDNNKIKTMLIDPTVYNKLMAKRTLNLESKVNEIKVKVEGGGAEPSTSSTPSAEAPVKVEPAASSAGEETLPPIKQEVKEESDADVVQSVVQAMLSKLEGSELKSETPTPAQPAPIKKYNTELINVSLGIVSANRILYPKIAHRINILDDLLSHRLKLVQMEEAQLISKYSTEYKFIQQMNTYKCYSYDCLAGRGCYSALCILTKINKTETSGKVQLRRVKPDLSRKGVVYPLVSSYMANKTPNIFVLQKREVMKLGRTGGRYSIPQGFNSNNKPNMLWFYQCGKPCFYKVWEFNLLTSFNLSSVGIAIRILYACIRWDDIQVKPPSNLTDGKNQITTDMEVITYEVLKHRVLGQFMNKIQYLRRKEVVPIDLPKTVREVTPSRLGLRKRKRTELQDKTDPTIVEEWVNENQIEIWEIRLYGDKMEKPKVDPSKKLDYTPIHANTRLKSGIVIKQPEKLDNSFTSTPKAVNHALEPLEPVLRTVHLSKRDNHVKINNNNVSKVQTPTASQQLLLQQQAALQKTGDVKMGVNGQGNPVTLHSLPANLLPMQRNSPGQQQGGPQGIASVAMQQIQEKQGKSPAQKRFFVTKTKDISPKPPTATTTTPVVARKSTPGQMQIAQPPPMKQTATPALQPQQRLQIVRTYDGKLQLKGLLPGQHAYQTADGKIHVITSNVTPPDAIKIEGSPNPPAPPAEGAGNQVVNTNATMTPTSTTTQENASTSSTTSSAGPQDQTVAGTEGTLSTETVQATGALATTEQVVVTSMATTPSLPLTQQIMVTNPGVPKPQQQIVMAPGTSAAAKPQLLLTSGPGKQQQFVMTAPANRQQIVMASTPGGKPQFVMTNAPSAQQFMITTGPGGTQQIIMTPMKQPGLMSATPLNQQSLFLQQPLINISTPAMKTVMGRAIQQQQPPRLQQTTQQQRTTPNPNIIKGKQAPILISKNPTTTTSTGVSNQGQIFLGQNQILINSQQPQVQQQQQPNLMTTAAGQGKQIVYTDGNKTYMINASGLTEAQIKVLTSQFQQKRFVVKKEGEVQGQGQVMSQQQQPSGQLFTTTGGGGQMVATPQGNAQLVTTSSGQLILVAPGPVSNIAQGQGQQQILGNLTPTNQPPTVMTVPVNSTSGVMTVPIKQEQKIVTPPRFTQQIVGTTNSTPAMLNRGIIGTPTSGSSPQIMQTTPEMARQNLTHGMYAPLGLSPTIKPNSLPISIVSPSKAKMRGKIVTMVSAAGGTSPNPPLVTMTPSKLTTSTLPTTKSPILLSPPMFSSPPTTTSGGKTPILISPTTTTTPILGKKSSPPPLTPPKLQAVSTPVQSVPQPILPGKNLFQEFIPASTMASQISNTNVNMNSLSAQVFPAGGGAVPGVSSTVSAQIFETAEGNKIVFQGTNKFSPEELARIQKQLSNHLNSEKEKAAQQAQKTPPSSGSKTPGGTTSTSTPESNHSSVDDSIDSVIQNVMKTKIPKKKGKRASGSSESSSSQSAIVASLPPPPPLLEYHEPGNKSPSKKSPKAHHLPQLTQKGKALALLSKYKELLKKDIEKKRTTMENELKISIQKEITEEKLGMLQPSATNVPSNNTTTASRGVKRKTSHGGGGGKGKKKRSKSHSSKADIDMNQKYCVCKTRYDDTKFYVGCEKCSNWFHGDCIGITQEMSAVLSDYICDACQSEEKTYCLCKKPYDEAQFYICCDKCQDWFHGRCIGIIQSESVKMDDYICPNCDANTELNAPNLKLLHGEDYLMLERVIKQLLQHKAAWAFIKPVDVKEAPNYYKVIKEPMDLQTVDMRVTEKLYTRLRDFIGDVTKIFDNCRYFNAENSEFYRLANTLEVYFKEKVILLRKKLIKSSP